MKDSNSADLFTADEISWRQQFRPTASGSKSRGEAASAGIYVDQTASLQLIKWYIGDSVGGFADRIRTGYRGAKGLKQPPRGFIPQVVIT